VWILSTASSEVVTLALLIPGVDIADCSGIANEVESKSKDGKMGDNEIERAGWLEPNAGK
jgi:hypothetical protein